MFILWLIWRWSTIYSNFAFKPNPTAWCGLHTYTEHTSSVPSNAYSKAISELSSRRWRHWRGTMSDCEITYAWHRAIIDHWAWRLISHKSCFNLLTQVSNCAVCSRYIEHGSWRQILPWYCKSSVCMTDAQLDQGCSRANVKTNQLLSEI